MKSFTTLAALSAVFVLSACTNTETAKPLPTDKPVVKPIEIKTTPVEANKPGEVKVNVEGADKPGMPKIEVKAIEAKPATTTTAAPAPTTLSPADVKVEMKAPTTAGTEVKTTTTATTTAAPKN